MNFLYWLMGSVTLDIYGMNLERFLMALAKNNISVSNVIRLSHNHFYIKTNCFYYKKLLEQADKLCYTISVKNITGIYAVYMFFKKRLALFITLVFGTVLTISSCFFVWQIKINGNATIEYYDISHVLKNNGVYVGKQLSKVDPELVEQLLYKNFDQISLVSATVYGTSLVINIKEKLSVPEMQTEFEPLCATQDGIIESITLISGTLNCKVGDTVKKGDVLVYPYTIDSLGEQHPIIALADVCAYVDVQGRVEYNENQINYTRTGKKTVCRYYNLFGFEISLDNNVNKYDNFERVVSQQYVSANNLLPLKIKTITYYQTIGEEVFVDFDKVKDQQIKLSKKLAYNNLPTGQKVLSEQTLVTNNQNVYYIITYLKTLQYIS